MKTKLDNNYMGSITVNTRDLCASLTTKHWHPIIIVTNANSLTSL